MVSDAGRAGGGLGVNAQTRPAYEGPDSIIDPPLAPGQNIIPLNYVTIPKGGEFCDSGAPKVLVGGTVLFKQGAQCVGMPTKTDGSACCTMQMWQPSNDGFYYDGCSMTCAPAYVSNTLCVHLCLAFEASSLGGCELERWKSGCLLVHVDALRFLACCIFTSCCSLVPCVGCKSIYWYSMVLENTDANYYYMTEVPGDEREAGWGGDNAPHFHYDIKCRHASFSSLRLTCCLHCTTPLASSMLMVACAVQGLCGRQCGGDHR